MRYDSDFFTENIDKQNYIKYINVIEKQIKNIALKIHIENSDNDQNYLWKIKELE